MSDKTVQKEAIEKALEAFKNLASEEKLEKGGNTISSNVPAMSGEGGKTQLFATPSDSNPGTWAGTSQTSVPENGATDGISDNGTDYGTKGMVKSILNLLAEKKINADVAAMLLEKALPFEKKDKDEEYEEKDEKKEVKKSVESDDSVEKSLTSSPAVSDAFEVSEFLKELVTGISKAISGVESRLTKKIEDTATSSGSFQKSLSNVVSTLGQAVISTNQRVEELATQPARAPKSVQVLEKSFGGRTACDELDEATITKSLVALHEEGKVHASDVIRFETSRAITEETLRKVKNFVSGK